MTSSSTDDSAKLFILGVERSGSTWLSNIFAASPDVSVLMEPFARVTHLFRGFPDRLSHVDRASPLLRSHLHDKFAELSDYKNFGFEESGASGWVRRLNWNTQHAVQKLFSMVGGGPGRDRRRYLELNFNRRDNRQLLAFEKSSEPSHLLVKELRLNFKVGMLREVFPGARFVVIIRNPLSQFDSILRQFERGSLVYLRHFLHGLSESLEGQSRFDTFRSPLETLPDGCLEARLVAYWFLNYAVLLEDLRRTDADYRLVRHETLSKDPQTTARDVLSFAGIEWSDQVAEYIRESSQTPTEPASSTDTTRDSSAYVQRALDRVDDSTRSTFWENASPWWSSMPDDIVAYRSWLRDRD